jgi:hypothetical protein
LSANPAAISTRASSTGTLTRAPVEANPGDEVCTAATAEDSGIELDSPATEEDAGTEDDSGTEDDAGAEDDSGAEDEAGAEDDSGAEDDAGTDEEAGAELDAGAEDDWLGVLDVQVAVGKNRPLWMVPACTSTCTKHRPSADAISGNSTVVPKFGPIWKSLFHWWVEFEPACGEASRF